jgi:DNA-binding transcriptional ArsR family regulator
MPYSGEGAADAKSARPMTAAIRAYADRLEIVPRVIVWSFRISKVMELERRYSMEAMATSTRPEKITHPPASSLDLPTIMRTLGDPVRLEIVRLLSDGQERLCGELSSALDIPTSTGSYHLRLLREAGITHARAEGTQRYITLRFDDLEARFPGLLAVLSR